MPILNKITPIDLQGLFQTIVQVFDPAQSGSLNLKATP